MPRTSEDRKAREAGFDSSRIPPGQYYTDKWPVLHAGSVPPADARARLSAAADGAEPLRLEERQVAARARVLGCRPAGVLGGLRLPQRRRPVEGGALRLLRSSSASAPGSSSS